jgi:hypothetical protein
MTPHTERLIRQLDDSTGPSYDARAELIGIGSDAIPAIIDGLPSLGGFGQLTAIEVFADLGLAIRSQRAGGIVLTRPPLPAPRLARPVARTARRGVELLLKHGSPTGWGINVSSSVAG